MKKTRNLVALLALSLAGILPLVSINNSKFALNKFKKTVSVTQLITAKQTKHSRIVHKFSGTHPLDSENIFQKLKSQFATANITIKLNKSSNYSYAIKYDNYDVFGVEHRGNINNNTKNSVDDAINVGVKLLANMTIRIGSDSKNWKKMSFTSLSKLNLANINPSSISYFISATGSKTSPTVVLKRSYTNRNNPDKVINQEIGFFNINNVNNNAKHFLSQTIGGVIVDIIIAYLALSLIASIVGGSLYKLRIKMANNSVDIPPLPATEMSAELSATQAGLEEYQVIPSIKDPITDSHSREIKVTPDTENQTSAATIETDGNDSRQQERTTSSRKKIVTKRVEQAAEEFNNKKRVFNDTVEKRKEEAKAKKQRRSTSRTSGATQTKSTKVASADSLYTEWTLDDYRARFKDRFPMPLEENLAVANNNIKLFENWLLENDTDGYNFVRAAVFNNNIGLQVRTFFLGLTGSEEGSGEALLKKLLNNNGLRY